MSRSVSIPVKENFNLQEILTNSKQTLVAQGYEVVGSISGPTSATMTVEKNDSGLKKILGAGAKAEITFMQANENTVMANIEDSWTSKIIAFVVFLLLGWCLIGIPFLIGGIIGCVAQSDISKKVSTALQLSAGSTGNGTLQQF